MTWARTGGLGVAMSDERDTSDSTQDEESTETDSGAAFDPDERMDESKGTYDIPGPDEGEDKESGTAGLPDADNVPEETLEEIESEREERLAADNRPDNVEVDNTQRTFDSGSGKFTDNPDYDPDARPFAGEDDEAPEPEEPQESGDSSTDSTDESDSSTEDEG